AEIFEGMDMTIQKILYQLGSDYFEIGASTIAQNHTKHPNFHSSAIPSKFTKVTEIYLRLFPREAMQRNIALIFLKLGDIARYSRIGKCYPMLLNKFLVNQ